MVRNLLGYGGGISFCGVQARADCGSSQCQTIERLKRVFDASNAVFDLLGITRKFLAERQWRGVLAVRPSDFDDGVKLFGFGLECLEENFQSGNGSIQNGNDGGYVHGGGKGVVGTLSHIAIVIRMNGGLAPNFPTHNHNGAVGQNFINVHVGLRPRSGLVNHQGELIVMHPGHDFVRGFSNGLGLLLRHHAAAAVGIGPVLGTTLLDEAHGVDDFGGHAGFPASDREVLGGTLRLRSPEATGRNGEFAEAVGFHTGWEGGDGRGGFIVFGGDVMEGREDTRGEASGCKDLFHGGSLGDF
mmetsp:Transcript_23795/g.49182  ORF Transcript_23795/g.49182 Transcript_23795/m.49182 type:complete len:300 (-) Transcript_23795:63-962(-)